ncbi:MAG: polysaccharide deacetylase [Proteobacteria bacterium]|nr:polysaccharide deacetylase [Pseudomonadota bacterium]
MADGNRRIEDLQPWQWPDDHWRGLVNRVRAGRRLAPETWPDGAKFAVAISFDNDHETGDLREGGASISRQSNGQYGARKGVPRILDILGRHGVPASFFVPAVSALLHPDEQRRIASEGHEVGIHGWIHELNSKLDEASERDLMLRSAETLERLTGQPIRGLRTPSWDFSPYTLKIAKEMGLAYDSSLMADDDCYELLMDGEPTGVVELPVEWIRDDAVYFGMNRFAGLRPHTPPSAVLEIFLKELEGAAAEGGIFQVTLHPHISGARSRVWILDEIIRQARALGGWFATHGQIVDYVKAQDADPA